MEHHDQSLAIKSVCIVVIDHDKQRYPTCGDYFENTPGHWVIQVSDTGNWRMNMAIAHHEFTELLTTHSDGIAEQSITYFDEKWNLTHSNVDDEPGNDPEAPYHKQHVFAECLERLLCNWLKVNWQKYEQRLAELFS